MRRSVKWGLTILVIVAAVGVIYYSGMLDEFELPTRSTGEVYEANGVTFEYPRSWSVANPAAEGAIAAVATTNDTTNNVLIQQVPESFGDDIQTASAYNEQFLSQSISYVNIQMINSSINNQEVVMHRYLLNDENGTQKEHVATWIKLGDGKMYVLLLSTTPEEYEIQRSGYDLVAGTFGLQSEQTSWFDELFNRG